MIIETRTHKNDTNEVGRIVINDTLDLIVVNEGNEYSIKIIKNNCIDLNVEEIEVDETEERG